MTEPQKEVETSQLDIIQQNEQKRKFKKQAINIDDTINNKLHSKNTSKKTEPTAQIKLTRYFNSINNSSTNTQNNKDQQQTMPGKNDNQIKIRQMQQKVKEKDALIEKMRRARQYDQNKYSLLYTQNKQFKKKARENIAKSMLVAAQLRREQRKQIDPRLGYFKDGIKTFIQGSSLVNIKKKIKQKMELIKMTEVDKKSKDHQKRERAMFRVEFLQKQINLLQKQLGNKQNQVNVYKEKLKLADKQENCQYSIEQWPIVFDQYQTLQLLGKGGFGQVYKCYDLEQNQMVALKVSKFKQDPQHQQQFIKHVTRQAQVQKKLNHPNIAKIYRLIQCSSSKVIFTLEYCSGPELSVYLKKHNCLDQKQAKIIIKQIISALNYLYNLKERIIHYDLKPSNIMFHNGLIKILDFGLCKPMDSQESRIQLTSQGVGTYWYLPPETFNQNNPQITSKVDIWSVGVIFYEMLYGKRPFGHGMSQNRIYSDGIILNATKVEFPGQTPKKSKVSQSTKSFIKECLQYDQQKRLNPGQAYQHEYFKK